MYGPNTVNIPRADSEKNDMELPYTVLSGGFRLKRKIKPYILSYFASVRQAGCSQNDS